MRRIHLICNAHLDPVWLWRWEEGCTEALSTFRTASGFINEFKGFKFNHNEAILYEWVRENEPALYEKIKEQVKADNFHVMGGWYLQPDCNMPTGESIVRNILMGRKFFSEEFGIRPTAAVNFDSFGHSKGMVQILTQAGYDSYLVCRPAKDNFNFKEQDFLWKGLNQSEIRVHRSDENYNSIMGCAASELTQFLKSTQGEQVSLFLWGVGDHGGGPSHSDLKDLEKLFSEQDETCILLHSTPEAYFAELAQKNVALPVVDRGLNPVADGCYTSQIRVKQKHRELENQLYLGEKMLTAASIQFTKNYPKARLDEAVHDLVFAEFHDALPGSGSQLVEEDTLRILGHGLEILSQEQIKAFITLSAGQSKVIDGTSSVLIYNPHPYPITDVFSFEVGLPKQNWENVFYYPEVSFNGKSLPSQGEMESSHFCIDWRKKVSVQLTLAPSAMHKLDISFKPLPKRPTYPPIIAQTDYTFDNGKLKVIINTATGLVDSYCVDCIEYLKPNSFQLMVQDATYNSWGLHSNQSHCRYTMNLLTPHEGSAFSGLYDSVAPSVRVIEDGDVRTVVEALFGWHNSYAYQRYFLPKSGSSFDVETGVYWNEKDMSLKLTLDTAIENGSYFGQVPFGHDTLKTTGEEVVSQKWVAYRDDNKAIAIINNGTHGSNMENGKLGLTLLRSAGYSAADGSFEKTLHEIRHTVRMEQGERIYSFRICAGNAKELFHRLDAQAQSFNEKPYALAFCPSGEGTLPKPLLTLDNEAIILTCMKLAEDKKGYILRFYESEGITQTVTVTLGTLGMTQTLHFNGFEIKTYYLDSIAKTLLQTTLLEGF